jgi:hypothetical protein
MRSPDFESSRLRVLQVPNHLFRGAAEDAIAYLSLAVRGCWEQAFSRELRLRFFIGFVQRRWSMALRRLRIATKLFSMPIFER